MPRYYRLPYRRAVTASPLRLVMVTTNRRQYFCLLFARVGPPALDRVPWRWIVSMGRPGQLKFRQPRDGAQQSDAREEFHRSIR
jgi:hypothetical protein